MHASTVAQCLRAFAAGVDLACGTFQAVVVGTVEHLADRLDPPPLDYAGFDTDVRLCNLDGYLRITQAEVGVEAALADAVAARSGWPATRAEHGPTGGQS